LIAEQKKLLQKVYASIYGFNIGMNCGATAGQKILNIMSNWFQGARVTLKIQEVELVTSLHRKVSTRAKVIKDR
jgi:hypothetical protein